jgi:lipid-binding SYLF domain-containing protein
MGTDSDANKALYGKDVDASQIVRDGAVQTPEAGKPLVDLLTKISPQRM